MYILMMSKRNHLIAIIKKGENVNGCIHSFDDVKEETNKALLQDQILPQNKGFQNHPRKLEVGN